MAPVDEDPKKRAVRKLTKKRKETRHVTVELPERFRDGDGDDADEDCTALHGRNAYMNQSVFGMIAAAGSQVDFNARFDGATSDEDEEPPAELLAEKSRREKLSAPGEAEKSHRRKFSESKLVRSLSGLGSGSKSKSREPGKSAAPALELPAGDSAPKAASPKLPVHASSRDAMVMSRMLEAKAEMSLRPSFDLPRPKLKHVREGAVAEEPASSTLAKQLMDIFDFETAEDVIEGTISVESLSGLTLSSRALEHTIANMDRVPLLVVEERLTSRIHVYYHQAHMLLCLLTQEICKS